ncbi:MAG: UDP-N-acetylglucosamine--N-acetylmuramyl-(pentapeptide) pyrophosphoryl-undecaprenol N-acetylglucosamine transferase [Anaeroplasmataceae bacterium]|nr:UDP-N-acetylglucosamine--N-acetylmuramyl-(pentapeptide) pyrophosphoryl-undecaprenol N-acetylglucosamine transferase [Anaeroplasmataceae bacterium]
MIALTGGKTGGHIMPLLAIANSYKNVCYVGGKGSLEESLCLKEQITFIGLDLKKRSIFHLFKEYKKLKMPKIDGIVSTGGYVSVPLLLYGIKNHIPIYLIEENVIMGRANQLFSLFAKKVFLTYELPKMKKKYEIVGLPMKTPPKTIISKFEFDILIIGGSLGSKPLCDLAFCLNEKYRICLVAGRYEEDYQNIKNVKTMKFSDDLINLMKKSKLVISRAGAATTYELFANNCPTILVPSKKTKQNHQYLNAIYFEKKGCCKLLKEENASKDVLKLVSQILSDEQEILNMKFAQKKLVKLDAVDKIIQAIGE